MPKASQDTKDTLGQSLDGFDQPPQVATMISTTHNYNTTNAAQKEEQSSCWVQLESNRGVWSHLHVWWVSNSSQIAQKKVIMAINYRLSQGNCNSKDEGKSHHAGPQLP